MLYWLCATDMLSCNMLCYAGYVLYAILMLCYMPLCYTDAMLYVICYSMLYVILCYMLYPMLYVMLSYSVIVALIKKSFRGKIYVPV